MKSIQTYCTLTFLLGIIVTGLIFAVTEKNRTKTQMESIQYSAEFGCFLGALAISDTIKNEKQRNTYQEMAVTICPNIGISVKRFIESGKK
jgi:hypothetical protein